MDVRVTDDNGAAGSYVTYSRLDILGRITQVTDAKGRLMTRHFYSIAGQPIHTHNIDSGHRWVLFNTAQKPVHQWDNRSNHIERTYDARQQPLHVLVQENGSATQLLAEQYIYGGTAATQYFRGRLTETRGQEGKTILTAYDFKGNVLSLTTQICATYNATINWNNTQAIDKSFIQISTFDAMNRPLTQTAPNQQTTVYTYGKGGLLDSLLVNVIRGITNVTYNARGQHPDVWFANGTVTTWYCYDAAGNRTRKVTEKPGGVAQERVYLGDYEVYTHKIGSTTHTLRETIHLTDNRHRFALVDKLKIDNGVTLSTAVITTRYQHDNHLGSASLELNQKAAIISYEEYHPYGTTSYRSGRTETEVAQKFYKYVGKERDEETGLYYYGARYFAAWLCRFVSVDPLQLKYPHYTPYQYAGNKPVSYVDLDGLEEYHLEQLRRAITDFYFNKKKSATDSDSISPITMVSDATNRINPYKKNNQEPVSPQFLYWENKMPGNSSQMPEPSSITPSMNNLAKWANTAIASETMKMVAFDPFFRGTSTGSLSAMSIPIAKAGLSTEFWAGKAIISASSQALLFKNIDVWDVASDAVFLPLMSNIISSPVDFTIGKNSQMVWLWNGKSVHEVCIDLLTGYLSDKAGETAFKTLKPELKNAQEEILMNTVITAPLEVLDKGSNMILKERTKKYENK